jgi:polyisoprenoid-binding protein YceI
VTNPGEVARILSRRAPLLGAILVVLSVVPASSAQESVFTLDPAETKIEFTLPATAHTVHGTFKLKSGEIRFDTSSGKASGTVVVDATSGESGSDGRDKKMHQEIIESPKFTDIVFTPEHVQGTVAPEGGSQIQMSGIFRLCGQEHAMTLTFAVEHAAGNQLKIETHFSVPYVEWGLKNPSTFILRVDKSVGVDIHAVGQLALTHTNR